MTAHGGGEFVVGPPDPNLLFDMTSYDGTQPFGNYKVINVSTDFVWAFLNAQAPLRNPELIPSRPPIGLISSRACAARATAAVASHVLPHVCESFDELPRPPRLIFAGQFQADPSTVNNDPQHFDSADVPVGLPACGPVERPTGGGIRAEPAPGDFVGCTVRRVVYRDGTSAPIPTSIRSSERL